MEEIVSLNGRKIIVSSSYLTIAYRGIGSSQIELYGPVEDFRRLRDACNDLIALLEEREKRSCDNIY